MTMLYTGYYARHGKLPGAISISVVVPRWYPGMRHCADLAPSWKLVEAYKIGAVGIKEYTAEYLAMLERRGKSAQDIIDELPNEAILLCYEKPPEFCHRHVAADWLRRSFAGLEIKEHA